jgi:hypothetical protein
MCIRFYFDEAAVHGSSASGDLHFCKPVLKARSGPGLLLPDAVTCVCAGTVLGSATYCPDEIIHEVRKRLGIRPDIAETVVSRAPGLEEAPCAIRIPYAVIKHAVGRRSTT